MCCGAPWVVRQQPIFQTGRECDRERDGLVQDRRGQRRRSLHHPLRHQGQPVGEAGQRAQALAAGQILVLQGGDFVTVRYLEISVPMGSGHVVVVLLPRNNRLVMINSDYSHLKF